MVHVLTPPYRAAPYGRFLVLEPDEQLRAAADAWLRQLADKVRTERPDLTGVQAITAIGHSAAVLIEQSRQAAVTVVGCRGAGGFEQLLLGSTSVHLATHGHGPIVVVHPPRHPPHGALSPVLACFDGSPASVAALRFAADEAALRNVPLTVAHVYERDEPAAKQLLIEAVDPWADDYTGRPIELRPIYSEHPPQYALLEASRNAALTVVGARGHSAFASLLLGSVSRYLIHNAYGPVAVVHPAEPRKEEK
jgi:nucleotide-binding universal stress UspA family protein